MKVILFGNAEISAELLTVLQNSCVKTVGVVTCDRPVGCSDYKDLSASAAAYNIPCHKVIEIDYSEIANWCRLFDPDLIVCIGWSHIISRHIFDVSRHGIVGYHPSALPANRGRHPIIWPLVLGLRETASTFFFLNERIDAGDIISQVSIPISEGTSARTLYNQIIKSAASQLLELMEKFVQGDVESVPQDETACSYWRKRSVADGKIDWRMGAQNIKNLINALSEPYGGAFFEFDGRHYTVLSCEIATPDVENVEPGKIIDLVDGLYPLVKCGTDAILLRKTKPSLIVERGTYI